MEIKDVKVGDFIYDSLLIYQPIYRVIEMSRRYKFLTIENIAKPIDKQILDFDELEHWRKVRM